MRLVLEVAPSGEVIVARREEFSGGRAIVYGWLQALAQTALDTRRRVAGSGKVWLSRAEEEGALPTSVEGMLAYIGLPWFAPRDWLFPSCLTLLALVAVLLTLIVVKLL